MPVNFTIINGIAGPFFANNEHLNKYLQEPVNKCVKQASKDN